MGIFDFFKKKTKSEIEEEVEIEELFDKSLDNIDQTSSSDEIDQEIEEVLIQEETEHIEINDEISENKFSDIYDEEHDNISTKSSIDIDASKLPDFEELNDVSPTTLESELEEIELKNSLINENLETEVSFDENVENKEKSEVNIDFTAEVENSLEINVEDNYSKEEKKKGFFSKIKDGLDKTRKNILGNVETVLKSFKTIDEELFEELEEVLIGADIGVETTMLLIEKLRKRVKSDTLREVSELQEALIEEISVILKSNETTFEIVPPTVILVIGVNGAGKTTSIGKLATNFKKSGKTVMLAAADTFRAAAIDQLEIWSERAGVPIIKHEENSDPASVIFDAIASAKAKKIDVLICDTAGRLHNKKNLMQELGKMYKIINKEYPEANLETFIVLDATTGQNALQQAKVFGEVCDITGIILTKLDGTAKGGIIIPIKNELSVPIRFIGVGEKAEDLQEFDADMFAKALFGEEN